MSQTYDKTFKQLLEIKALAVQFVQTYLPEEFKSHIDITTFKNEKCDFIEENLKACYTDVLISCKLKNQQKGLIFCLIEHQTKNDPLMPLRIFRYTCSVLEHYAKTHNVTKNLPTVFPLVFFTGKGQMKNNIYDLFADKAAAEQLTFKPASVVTVNYYTRDALLSLSPDIFFMTQVFSVDEQGENKLLSIFESENNRAFKEHLRIVDKKVFEIGVQCIVKLTKKTPDEVMTMLSKHIPEQKEAIMSAYDHLIAQGEAIGKAKGEVKGEINAKTESLVNIVNKLSVSIEEAADIINASPEVIKKAKLQLNLK